MTAVIESFVEIKIPTSSYLRKWALHRYNSNNGRIRFSTKRSLGIVLLKILQKHSRDNASLKKGLYDSSITIEISEAYMKQYGFFLTTENINFLNKELKYLFEESLYDHILISLMRDKTIEIEDEILRSLAFYNITEDELKLETVKKDFYRWRSERNIIIIK